jgi:hypothetical protein
VTFQIGTDLALAQVRQNRVSALASLPASQRAGRHREEIDVDPADIS